MNGRFSMLAAMLGRVPFFSQRRSRCPFQLYMWNASESVPLGLYRLRPADKLSVTELVAVQPPEPLATFLDLNGYLPSRHSHVEARAGASGANGLQKRAHHLGR